MAKGTRIPRKRVLQLLYGVHRRTFELIPRDDFLIVDAPDELAARLGADRTMVVKDPGTHNLLRIIGDIISLDPAEIPLNKVDCVVDRNGEEVSIEVL